MTFWLGCAVWSYKDWVGDFFPTGSRSADFLRLYSQRLTAVEGNTTFYATPDADTVQRWVLETPETFRFCLKLPREVTHQGALMPRLPQAIAFLDQMRPLGDRLGPLFAQLPPWYRPTQLDDLHAFLTAWKETQVPLAVEVRHLDWFKPAIAQSLRDLLHSFGVGQVLLDTRPIYDCPDDPQLTSERRKPRVPVQTGLTTHFTLVRYISHPNLSLNQSYLDEWANRVVQWVKQGTQVYFFVHCPVEARSPATARHFYHRLLQRYPQIVPLPWEQMDQPPAQLRLF